MYFRLLLSSLRYRKWRLLQQAVTVAITSAVIMLFLSVVGELVSATKRSAINGMTRIIVEPTMYTADWHGFPGTLKKKLQGVEGVQHVNCFRTIDGRLDAARYFIVGEELEGLQLNRGVFPIDMAALDAWKNDRIAAYVGEEVAKDLKLEVGKLVELPTSSGPIQLKIVGIAPGALFPNRIATHVEYIQAITKQPDVCEYRVFSGPGDSDRAIRGIIEMSKTTPIPMEAYTDSKLLDEMMKSVAFIPSLLGLLGMFLLLTTALTLANSSAISIRERRIETSTLRVLGYKPRLLVALLLGESLAVGLVGAAVAIIGCKIALGSGVQLAPDSGGRVLQQVTIGKLGMLGGVAIALIVPVLGTLLSALAAVRAPLAEALRDAA